MTTKQQAFQCRCFGVPYATTTHPDETNPVQWGVEPTEDAIALWRTRDYGETWSAIGAWVREKRGWSLRMFVEAEDNG